MLGIVASRNGRSRNGRVRNGRSRIGCSRIGTSAVLPTDSEKIRENIGKISQHISERISPWNGKISKPFNGFSSGINN